MQACWPCYMICSESFNKYACACGTTFTLLTINISRIKRIIPIIISPNIIYLSFCYGFYYELDAFYCENLNFCFFKKRCFVGLYRPCFLLKTALGWEKLRFVYLGNNASEWTPKQKVGGSFPFGTPIRLSSLSFMWLNDESFCYIAIL